MPLNQSTKALLCIGSALALFSTPILAGHGLGLRGAQPVPQYYVPQPAPMASPMQQQVYAPNVYAPNYVPAAQQIPVGNYQYASLAPALRGPSNGFDFAGTSVRTNARHTEKMLDWQENTTGKTLTLLANKANGTLVPNSLTIGAGLKGSFMWQKTSVDGQFPILSRFPDFSARTDDEAGVFAINNAAIAFTGTFGDWTSFYLQPEYSETDFSSTQDEFQLRKAFVVFGNLHKTPLYAAFGRKTIDFGNFDGYNAFTQTEAQHYFWALSDQPVLEVGYYNINTGFKLSATAFSGGRQLRTAYAGEENNIGNYAASIEKEFRFRNGSAFTVGTSYLHDTIYRNNFTAHTFGLISSGTPPANFIQYRNSAVDAFAEYTSPFFDAMVEYTTTLEPWAAAIPQDAAGNVDPAYLNTAGNITFDQKLAVLVAQARIKPMLPNGRRLSIAAVGSWGSIGDDFVGIGIGGQPTTWEKNQQHALSVEYPISDYLEFGAEYVYNKGFIPFVAPQLVSNDETTAHAINVGFKARF
jgi:hypothetical protein